MTRDCCTSKCASLAKRDKRLVVWKAAGNYYCNVCFLNELEAEAFEIDTKIIRLYDDDDLYQDLRVVKRPNRVPGKQASSGMTRAHA
jgi:hypothetical protein